MYPGRHHGGFQAFGWRKEHLHKAIVQSNFEYRYMEVVSTQAAPVFKRELFLVKRTRHLGHSFLLIDQISGQQHVLLVRAHVLARVPATRCGGVKYGQFNAALVHRHAAIAGESFHAPGFHTYRTAVAHRYQAC